VLSRLLLGDRADVAGQDDAAAGDLFQGADVQPGVEDGPEEALERLVVETDPATEAGTISRGAVGPADLTVANREM
jgi:hypothetical protein